MTDLTLPCGCELKAGQLYLCRVGSGLLASLLQAWPGSDEGLQRWELIAEHLGEENWEAVSGARPMLTLGGGE